MAPRASGAHPARAAPAAPTATATATATTAPPTSTHQLDAPAPAPAAEQPGAAPFNWLRHWWPVSPLPYLDPARPNPIMLGGKPLVVWRHATAGWTVVDDQCPHRLSPLSEGRLEGGGTRLACAYHGWEFDQAGACTRIPQLVNDPKAAAVACSSRRSCVTAYPATEHDGVLFVWMDPSPEGLLAKEAAPPLPQLMDPKVAPFDWFMNVVPNDFPFWLEQAMDPAHACFLHHGLASLRKENAVPMTAERIGDPDLQGGFTWNHRGYEAAKADMVAVREFLPPFRMTARYELPYMTQHQAVMQSPVRPGVVRLFTRFGFGGPAKKPAAADTSSDGKSSSATDSSSSASSAAAGDSGSSAPKAAAKPAADPNTLMGVMMALLKRGKLPHWWFDFQLISDQDIIMMVRQEGVMRTRGLDSSAFYLNSPSDEGVAVVNKWLRMAGYPDSLWGAAQRSALSRPRTAPGEANGGGSSGGIVGSGAAGAAAADGARAATGLYGSWPDAPLTLEQIFDRHERHVRHCAECQRGEKLVTRVCYALTAAAAAAFCGAAAAAMVACLSPQGVAAVGGAVPLAAVVAAAVGLAVVAVRAWRWREIRFVTGLNVWREKGGFAVLDLTK